MQQFIERNFELTKGGQVTIRFFRPEPREVDYCCEYAIIWPDRERRFHGYGIDEVQALLLAMQNAHMDLLASPEGKAGELTWLGMRNLDLPLPKTMATDDFK